jgi:hypothetical protein
MIYSRRIITCTHYQSVLSAVSWLCQALEITKIQHLSKSLQSAKFNRLLDKIVFTAIHLSI